MRKDPPGLAAHSGDKCASRKPARRIHPVSSGSENPRLEVEEIEIIKRVYVYIYTYMYKQKDSSL